MKTSTVAEGLLERNALTGEDGKSGGSGSSVPTTDRTPWRRRGRRPQRPLAARVLTSL